MDAEKPTLNQKDRRDDRQHQEKGLAQQQAASGNRTAQPEGGAANGGVPLNQSRHDHCQQADFQDKDQRQEQGQGDSQKQCFYVRTDYGPQSNQGGMKNQQKVEQGQEWPQATIVFAHDVQRQVHGFSLLLSLQPMTPSRDGEKGSGREEITIQESRSG